MNEDIIRGEFMIDDNNKICPMLEYVEGKIDNILDNKDEEKSHWKPELLLKIVIGLLGLGIAYYLWNFTVNIDVIQFFI